MNIMDLMGGGNPFGGSSNPLNALSRILLAGGVFGIVVSVLAIIVFIGAIYMLNSYTLLYIGRKSGLQNDWMAFVPFALTIYWLKIVDEPWWKMFILGDWPVYYLILNLLLGAINSIFAMVVSTIYLAGVLAYNVYFRMKYYRAFGIAPVLGLQVLTPFGLLGIPIFDALIAFTDNYQYVGAVNPAPDRAKVSSSPKPGLANSGITGLSGMYAGQTLPLASNEEMIVGRDNTCNLIINQNAEKLSRKHCSIVYDSIQGIYSVTDYSTNGTYIEGGNRLIANMPTGVNRGSIIALGNRENRFRLN